MLKIVIVRLNDILLENDQNLLLEVAKLDNYMDWRICALRSRPSYFFHCLVRRFIQTCRYGTKLGPDDISCFHFISHKRVMEMV